MDRIEKIIGITIILGGVIAMLISLIVGVARGGVVFIIFGAVMCGVGIFYLNGPTENHNTAKMRAEAIKRLKKYVK